MKRKFFYSFISFFACALFTCVPPQVDDSARIHYLIGDVDILSGSKKIIPVVGGVLSPKDEIITAKKSACDLLFRESLLVRIGELAKAQVGEIALQARAVLEISRGRMVGIFTHLKKETTIRVRGTTVTIAVRGTIFAFECDEKSSALSVLSGTADMEIEVPNKGQKVYKIQSGTFAKVEKDIIEDIVLNKKSPQIRKLLEHEKSTIIDELVIMQQESIPLLSSQIKEPINEEIQAVLKTESEKQRKKREREAVLKKAAEEARKKAEEEELLRKKREEEERLKREEEEKRMKEEEERRKKEEEERRKKEEEDRRKKEAEEIEKKKREAARKATPKKQKVEQKQDRSIDTSGN